MKVENIMNAPERWELFVLPEGVKKVVVEPDTKVPNCATFRFACEDHTLGNLLCYHLQQHTQVTFAGYRVPHPLEHNFELRVQCQGTGHGGDGIRPVEAVQQVISQLMNQITALDNNLKSELARFI